MHHVKLRSKILLGGRNSAEYTTRLSALTEGCGELAKYI